MLHIIDWILLTVSSSVLYSLKRQNISILKQAIQMTLVSCLQNHQMYQNSEVSELRTQKFIQHKI